MPASASAEWRRRGLYLSSIEANTAGRASILVLKLRRSRPGYSPPETLLINRRLDGEACANKRSPGTRPGLHRYTGVI